MQDYADYKYYKFTYKGSLSNDLFNNLIPKASRIIDRVVNRDLEEVDITDKVKFVACEIVELMNKNGKGKDNAVSSVSLDGVSKTFSVKTNQEYKSELFEILSLLPNELTRCL